MADQADVFDEKQKDQVTDQVTTDPSKTPDYADLLARVVNEDGKPKYNSIDEAIKALEHSQKFIPQLQSEAEAARTEAATLKAQLEKLGTVEDVVNRLTKGTQPPAAKDDKPETEVLDADKVKGLFAEMLNETRANETAETNSATVNKALKDKFGDKASEAVAQKAKELGTTAADLGALAKKSPAMVLALFGSTAPKSPSVTTTSHSTQLTPPKPLELDKPTKSLLSGATSKEQADYMREIKRQVYAKHGINQN